MSSTTIAFLTDTHASVPYAKKLKDSTFTTNVFTDDDEVAKSFAEEGINVLLEREEVLKDAEVVITYYGDSLRSESAYIARKGGLLSSCKEGTLFINLSQTTPAISRDIASVAKLNKSIAVDAPVDNIGAIFVGAERTDSPVLADIIDVLSDRAYWFGTAGSGTVAYLAQEISVASTLMGMCDAMALCQVEDVNLDRVVKMLTSGMAQSYIADRFAQKAADGDYKDNFTSQELRRDVAAALMRADERELALPGSQTAFTLLDTLCEMGGKNLGIQTMSVMYQDEAEAAAAGLDWSKVSEGGLESYFEEDAVDEEQHDDHCHHDHCDDDHCGCHH